jgi:hypothetical protein
MDQESISLPRRLLRTFLRSTFNIACLDYGHDSFLGHSPVNIQHCLPGLWTRQFPSLVISVYYVQGWLTKLSTKVNAETLEW